MSDNAYRERAAARAFMDAWSGVYVGPMPDDMEGDNCVLISTTNVKLRRAIVMACKAWADGGWESGSWVATEDMLGL